MKLKIFDPIFSLVWVLFLFSHSGFSQKPIKIEKDVPFGETINYKGEREALLLDVYAPTEGVAANRPAIMWMHGGGFRLQHDKSQSYIVEMATRFAKRGYVCLSINYRVREDPKSDKPGTMKDALEDAMKGLNWLREHSNELGVDKSKIVVGGGSAGGILGNHFCYRDSAENEQWDRSGIVAFVNLWGSPDESWGTYLIDKNDPPMIIVHGTEDDLVPYENSLEIVKRLNQADIKNELITIEGAGHTPVGCMDDFEEQIANFLSRIIANEVNFHSNGSK
ncbi:MAG: alpha/beta hydrolase [Cyclobacteriaceae bacterium]|nr:alpha/beta hydrolase [Cyclobacteriaceae bacterium]